MRLAGEEACSNIINHAYRGTEPGPILLDVRCDDAQVVLLIEDRAPVFKPADAPPPDLTGDWEQRREGGLGWHLIKSPATTFDVFGGLAYTSDRYRSAMEIDGRVQPRFTRIGD